MIVDAHEDLAWNMQTFARDYTRSVAELRRAEAGSTAVQHNGQTMLGWPDWIRGRVGLVFAVLHAAPSHAREGPWDVVIYEDPASAHAVYWRQMDLYHRLLDEHEDKFGLIASQRDLSAHRQAWEREDDERRVGLVLSMEGAEGVGEPAELEAWHDRGLRIVGPAWDRTRYAGSGYEPGPLTGLGRELLEVMGELGMILDISHLSEEAALQALDSYRGAIIASHANPRRLIPNTRYPGRHLSDTVMEGLLERDGVQGIALANKFLRDGWRAGDRRELVTIDHVVQHIDYVCQMAGNADHVGLGSDFDGGFGLEGAPTGLDSIADLDKIGQALIGRGYKKDDMLKVLGANWIRILDGTLSST